VCHQPPAIARQQPEEVELGWGQMDLLAAERDRAGGQVDAQLPGLDQRLLGLRVDPAHVGLEPDDQFARPNGLVT